MNEKNILDKKTLIKLTVLSCIFSLIPIPIGTLLYDKIPDVLPTRFDFNGNVTGYSGKNHIIYFLPLLMVLITIISGIITYYDPFDKKLSNKSPTLVKISIFSIPILSNFFFLVAYLHSVNNINISTYGVNIILGVLFILIGNYLPKNKQNSVIGIKTPWSLKDEVNWNKTNRLGGYTFIISGILFISLIFFNRFFIINKIIIALIIILMFVPSIYSFWLYKKSS